MNRNQLHDPITLPTDGLYVLRDRIGYPATDFYAWAKEFEDTSKRRVAETIIDEVWISTVFLGIDHRFRGDGPPILFETMAFCASRLPQHENEMMRCSTWAEAEAQHLQMCERVKQWLDQGEKRPQ